MTLEQALTLWLPGQRWFAGKGRPITEVAIVSDTDLTADRGGGAVLRHLLVAVTQGSTQDLYQIPVGLRHVLPGRLEHAKIGETDEGHVAYDALHDSELTRLLLADIAAGQVRGPLRFAREPGAPLDGPLGAGHLESLVLAGEQSNTSLIFDEAVILKVFRRVAPGLNPDLEICAALARLGSTHVAEPFGWIETSRDGEAAILAIASRYLRAASDGWSLAATSVRDRFACEGIAAADCGGDFGPEAHRLGAATAAVHRDLLTAFGGAELAPGAERELAGPMRRRLADALQAVPELAGYAGMVEEFYARLEEFDEPLPVQRIHGDYHLGQVMRTQIGWVLLDFEGEPAVPLAHRRAFASPLRDIAGMLRSFDYAARHQMLGQPDPELAGLEPLARDWVGHNSDAFCSGYAQASGSDPGQWAAVLRAFEADKAVYETVYEARNRPSWLAIPLGSLAAMRVSASAGRGEDTP